MSELEGDSELPTEPSPLVASLSGFQTGIQLILGRYYQDLEADLATWSELNKVHYYSRITRRPSHVFKGGGGGVLPDREPAGGGVTATQQRSRHDPQSQRAGRQPRRPGDRSAHGAGRAASAGEGCRRSALTDKSA